jgi:hypothetical protein
MNWSVVLEIGAIRLGASFEGGCRPGVRKARSVSICGKPTLVYRTRNDWPPGTVLFRKVSPEAVIESASLELDNFS